MRLQSIFLGEPGPIINRVQGPPPNFIQLGPPGNRRSIEVTAYSANSSPFSQVQGSLFSTFGDLTGKELSQLLPQVATKHKTPEPFRGNQLSTLISQVTDHHLRRTLVETGEKRLVFFFLSKPTLFSEMGHNKSRRSRNQNSHRGLSSNNSQLQW